MNWIEATPEERAQINFNEFDQLVSELEATDTTKELLMSYARLLHQDGRTVMWHEIYD